MHLFAYESTHVPGELPTSLMVVAIVAGGLLFLGFLSWLGVRQAARSRELSHLEHMKSLELGKSIGPSESEKRQAKYVHNVFWICFWIGAAVPIAVTSSASAVEMHSSIHEFRIILGIWICVAVISVASVICATVLMSSGRRWSAKEDKDASGNGGVG